MIFNFGMKWGNVWKRKKNGKKSVKEKQNEIPLRVKLENENHQTSFILQLGNIGFPQEGRKNRNWKLGYLKDSYGKLTTIE